MAAFMVLSPTAFSQSYTGSISDLNSVLADPPLTNQGIFCKHGTDQEQVVCRDGLLAARWMAEKYAQRAGQYLGCVDGFSQGISDGYDSAKNASGAVRSEASQYVANVTMDSASLRAQGHASDKAVTESATDVISRYRSVVNQGVTPNKQPNLAQLNSIQFEGFQDGYTYDIENGSIEGGSFKEVINAGYVSDSSSFNDKIKARVAHTIDRSHLRNLCDVNTTIFGRNSLPQYSLWDYLKGDRKRSFQKYGWKNGSWAFSAFTDVERNTDSFDGYEGLKHRTVEETITKNHFKLVPEKDSAGKVIPVMVTDANGVSTQKLDSDGIPVFKMKEVFTHTTSKKVTRKVNAKELKNLETVYRDGFINAYEIDYARIYASKKYHTEGLAQYNNGKVIGQLIGKDVADQVARRDAYNTRYKEVSRTDFHAEVKRLYLESFNNLLDVFENNAVLEISGKIEGTNPNDQILTAGEGLRAKLDVTNLGEVTESVKIRLLNSNGINPESTQTIRPASLVRESIVTQRLGSISSGANPHDELRATVAVESSINDELVQPLLDMTESQDLVVRGYTELSATRGTLNVLNGTLGVTVELENPSSIESPSIVDVELHIESLGIVEKKSSVTLPGRKKQLFRFDINSLSSMKLIDLGSIEVVAKVVSANGADLETNKFTLASNLSKKNAYAQLFNSLVSSNNADQSTIDNLMTKVSSLMDEALRKKVKWNKQDQVNGSILGQLQRIYKDQKAAGKLTDTAIAQYDVLARRIAKKVTNKGSMKVRGGFLGISRRKNFLKAVQVISPSISIKWKDHR
jgi:hypothetical protein